MDQIILFTILSILLFSLCVIAIIILKAKREENIKDFDDFDFDFKNPNLIFFDKNFKKKGDKIRENLSRKRLVSSEDGKYFIKSEEVLDSDIEVIYLRKRNTLSNRDNEN